MNLIIVLSALFVSVVHAQSVRTDMNREALVIVEQAGEHIKSVDPATGQSLGRVKVGFNPHEIEVSPDGQTAYVSNFGIQDYDETIGTPGNTISVINLSEMKEIKRFSTGADAAPHGVKLRPPFFNELYANMENGDAMQVFDVKSGKLLRRFSLDADAHNFLFSPDGNSLWVIAGVAGVIQIDAITGKELGRVSLSTPARGIAFSPDKNAVLVAGRGELGVFDAKSRQLKKHFTDLGVGQILYATFTNDGSQIIAPAVWDSQVLIIDNQSGKVLKRIITGLDPVAVVINAENTRAFVSNARSRHVSCIDLKSYAHEKCISAVGPNGMAFGKMPKNPSSHASKNHQSKIIFGVPLPLSGRESYFGREMMLGYEFWKETVNVDGGIKIGPNAYAVEIEYRDTQSDNTQIPIMADSLVGSGVQYFLGTYGTPANGLLADVAQAKKIPLVTSAGAAPSLYEKNNSWLFGIMSPASEYLKGSIEFVANPDSGVRKIALIAKEAPAPLEDVKAAQAYAAKLGLQSIPEIFVFKSIQQEVTNLVKNLRNQRPDFILFAGDLSDAEAFVKESAAQKFKPLGFSFSVGPSLQRFYSAQGAGHLAMYMMGATQWSAEANLIGDDRYKDSKYFAKTFWDRYFTLPNYLSAGAVATGLSFEDALVKSGSSNDRLAVRDNLQTQSIKTFYGPIEFNLKGLNARKPVYTIQPQPNPKKLNEVHEVIVHPVPSGTAVWPFPGF